jgi:S-adenosylmethionine:tRNA ribosyltransferase-isomerase
MVVRQDAGIQDACVSALPAFLRRGDMVVFNDTSVIPARLFGVRERDRASVAMQATLLKRLSPDRWTALAKPGRRLRVGDAVIFDHLSATVAARHDDGSIDLVFDRAGPALDDAIRDTGRMPLPPYIAAQRPADERDRADYQTVYARKDGSVAAPTAGLHFTNELFAALDVAGVGRAFVTMHVGAGTFLPVKVEDLALHRMHAETGEVSAKTADRLNAARTAGGRIICVGTTSMRLLESATDADGVVQPFAGETDIFITPGYRFRAADVLMTNFHLPKSTLLVLVSAFAGVELTRAAYLHAVESGYRFYSYGDAGLWFPASLRSSE